MQPNIKPALIFNSGHSPACSPPTVRFWRQEAVDWPEAHPGPCALESGGSGSGQCHSSAFGLPVGPCQHLCFSGTGTRAGTVMCAGGWTEMVNAEKEQDSSYPIKPQMDSSLTLVSQVNSETSPRLMVMTTLSHTASLNFLPKMSSMGLLWPPMVLESSRTVPSHRLVR